MSVGTAGSRPATRRRVFYGWWVVLAGLLQNFYTSGTFYYGFGAFFNPIVDEFKWTRAATSGAFSIQQSESGTIAPFVGWIIDKFGPRRVMLVGCALTGTGFILLSRTSSLLTFYLSMVVLALGLSLGSYIVVVTTVCNWFVRKRGLAMAVFSSGAGFAGILAPVLVLLINALGWRTALMWVGVGTWAIGVPVALLLKRRPEDHGMLPDGDIPGVSPGEEPPARPLGLKLPVPSSRKSGAQDEFTAREALRTRSFWLLALAFTVGGFSMSAINVHLLPTQVSYGFSRETAALTVTLMTVLSLGGRWVGGYLSDFTDERYILAVGYALQAAGIVALGLAESYWQVGVFLVLYAPGFGATVPTRTVIQGRYFGRRAFGTLMGVLTTITTLIGLLAPVLLGWMFDVQQTYRPGLMAMAGVCFAAAPLMLICRKPARRQAA